MRVLIACEESQEVCKAAEQDVSRHCKSDGRTVGRVTMGIKTIGYKKARKEYFETLKAKHERSLTYWLRLRKGASVHEGYEIDEKCNDHGVAIQYCEDAIRALEMMDKEENRNGNPKE